MKEQNKNKIKLLETLTDKTHNAGDNRTGVIKRHVFVKGRSTAGNNLSRLM